MHNFITILMATFLYLSIICLLAGTLIHFFRWKTAPATSVFMPLFPDDKKGLVKKLMDALLLPGAFKTNKFIWLMAFFMHLAGPLIIVSHLRLFFDSSQIPSTLNYAIDILVLFLIPSLIIFFLRKLRNPYTSICVPDDYLLILLFIAAIVTGAFLHFFDGSSQQLSQDYVQYILTFGPLMGSDHAVVTSLPLVTHVLVVSVLFIYLPFSNFVYFVAGSLLSHFARRPAQ